MLRFITLLVSLILLFSSLIFLPSVSAHEEPQNADETGVIVEEINSFEVFWPMVAGKTMADGFVYNLKLLKEKVRGWLIFGTAQKADYQVFLATKRVLEAEVLLAKNKDELAVATLERARTQLSLAQDSLQKAEDSDSVGDTSQLTRRAENIIKLVSWLATKREGEMHSSLEKVGSEALALLSDN